MAAPKKPTSSSLVGQEANWRACPFLSNSGTAVGTAAPHLQVLLVVFKSPPQRSGSARLTNHSQLGFGNRSETFTQGEIPGSCLSTSLSLIPLPRRTNFYLSPSKASIQEI